MVSAKRTILYLLSFQGYPPVLEAFRPLAEQTATSAREKLEICKTYSAHVRLTHLPFHHRRFERIMPSLLDDPDATGNTQRSGHEREPRIHQEGRWSWCGGAAKGATTNRQPKQTGRMRGQRLDDSGTQAQGRRQGRAEESRQDRAQGHPQDASDNARPIFDGVGHSADQGVEPRCGQHAGADADLRREGAARRANTYTRGPSIV